MLQALLASLIKHAQMHPFYATIQLWYQWLALVVLVVLS
jgi:hypothetical protein